ncbi:hypothetical protein BGW80DRAFT_902684 [Lactifluus volemus]|nr:hypothetical protein BGW80DRAFT_902684 [Lactifluus volemus]
MEIVRDSHSIYHASDLGKLSWHFSSCSLCDGTIGPILLAILLHALCSGIVGNQFYVYWTSGFMDSKRIKIFVIIQFTVLTVQVATLWTMAWNFFIANHGLPVNLQMHSWTVISQEVCLNVLVLSANVFLAHRIHSLTKSRLQIGLVMAFSAASFIIGIVNTMIRNAAQMTSSEISLPPSTATKLKVAFDYGSQAVAECLITIFLVRALSMSRSGFQKSDSVVTYLIRRVILIGSFATLWVVAGLLLWVFSPKTPAYMLLTVTAGPVYTHAIFATLLSRPRLRKRLAQTSKIVIEFCQEPQAGSETHEGQRASSLPKTTDDTVAFTTILNQSLATGHAPDLEETVESDDSGVECSPVGPPGAHDESSDSPC